ncbi:hydrogenase maturation nickel metallochaperone HypA [Corynebacterium atrinae]|uniref:hydrogenase maturation nickel metallochaperone HypA/HybF n=1 Tax=Corynebacterium atrinae TaxID=1336740 RepID=UPI0025B3B152|nr:hydrogenase maturation nickel metallochaperone HypA [Corynebacterium atrinae]
MHEVALSTQLAGVVSRAAGDRRVLSVHLQIGQLRQVVPDTLRYAWSMVTRGTLLAEASLSIDSLPVRLTCPAGHCSEVDGELDLHCPRCGEIAAIVGGEEFTVVDIEVESLSVD